MSFLFSLQKQKRIMRSKMRDKRHHLAVNKDIFSNKLSDVFLAHVKLEKNSIVASYHAFRDEADPHILNEALRERGHTIAYPVIVAQRSPLAFRLYVPGDPLIAHPSTGILEPTSAAPIVVPDVLLVPLLAFDQGHRRLGYGGGYYDRTIIELRKSKPLLVLGIAYSFQEVATVPTGTHDVELDHIITELRMF